MQTVCDQLVFMFRKDGWATIAASGYRNRPLRLAHLLATTVLRRHSYDVAYIEVYSGKAFVMAEACAAALRSLGKPYVLNLQGGELPEFARDHPRRVRRLLRNARLIVAPSPHMAHRLGQRDIEVVPNSVHIESYIYRLRTPLRPTLIWVRAFHDIYAPTVAVRALCRLAAEHPEARLMMLGPDKGDGSLAAVRDEATRARLQDRVVVVGPVPKPEVPGWLAQADVFVNTSRIDNFPVSVLEAMASGLCVISTNVGGLPHLIDHGVNGFLVDPDDEVLIADIVRELVNDPGLAQRVSSEARRTAEEFDAERVVDRWKEIFSSAASSHDGRV